jgi:hypothetical protein
VEHQRGGAFSNPKVCEGEISLKTGEAKMRASHVAVVLCAVLVFLSGVVVGRPKSAQVANRPSKQDLKLALKDVDYALRRFEEASNKINFARWNTSYGLVAASRDALDVIRNSAMNAKKLIERLENSEEVSSLSLLGILEAVSSAGDEAASLGQDVRQFTNDIALATELTNTATLGHEAATKFRPFLLQQIEAQEQELALCRSADKPRR